MGVTDNIDIVEHLAVLELKPGDLLVLTYPDILTVEQAEQLKTDVQAAMRGQAQHHEMIVLSGGMEIGAVRMSTA